MSMDWKDSFNPRVLARGWQFYRNGQVGQILRDHDIYFASVAEDALVQAQIDEGQIIALSCSCPLARTGGLCPHEAAFLFALEDCENLQDIPDVSAQRSAPQDMSESIKEEQTAEEEIQEDTEKSEENPDSPYFFTSETPDPEARPENLPEEDREAETLFSEPQPEEEQKEVPESPAEPVQEKESRTNLSQTETPAPAQDTGPELETAVPGKTADWQNWDSLRSAREITLASFIQRLSEEKMQDLLVKMCLQSPSCTALLLLEAPDSLQDEACMLLQEDLEKNLMQVLHARRQPGNASLQALDALEQEIRSTVSALEKRESGLGLRLLVSLLESAEGARSSADLKLLGLFLEDMMNVLLSLMQEAGRPVLDSLFSWTELHLQQKDLPDLKKDLENLMLSDVFSLEEMAERRLQILMTLLNAEKESGRIRGVRARKILGSILDLKDDFPALLENTDVWHTFQEQYGQSSQTVLLEADRTLRLHHSRESEDLLFSLTPASMTLSEQKRFYHDLLELYTQNGQTRKALMLMKQMVSHFGVMTAEDLKQMKELENEEDFRQDYMQARRNMNRKELLDFLQEAGWQEELLEILEEHPILHELEQLDLDASDLDPKRVGDLWLRAAENEAEKAATPADWQRAVNALHQAAVHPETREKAQKTAENWKAEHPRKRTLLAQLDSLGF